jgi:hypothetical protein
MNTDRRPPDHILFLHARETPACHTHSANSVWPPSSAACLLGLERIAATVDAVDYGTMCNLATSTRRCAAGCST